MIYGIGVVVDRKMRIFCCFSVQLGEESASRVGGCQKLSRLSTRVVPVCCFIDACSFLFLKRSGLIFQASVGILDLGGGLCWQMYKSVNQSLKMVHLLSEISILNPAICRLLCQILLIKVLKNTLASPAFAGHASVRIALLEMASRFPAFAFPTARGASPELPSLKLGRIG
jgi:hypothetical protein